MTGPTAGAIVLAIAGAVLTNAAYQREHNAAAALPDLSVHRPIDSLRLLLGDRGWMRGFLLEGGGFACYAGAVALGPLALVQSIGAGGIGVLAWLSARLQGRRLQGRKLAGVCVSVIGLAALGISLARGSGEGMRGATVSIIVWILVISLLALVALGIGRARGGVAIAEGVAGGLFFSIGDLSTKLATQGGTRFAFVLTLILGYLVGTSLLQIGYQRGGALTVAGIATLLTNAVPIAAGTVLLAEPIPGGLFGVLRVGAFCAVVGGAILLAGSGSRTISRTELVSGPALWAAPLALRYGSVGGRDLRLVALPALRPAVHLSEANVSAVTAG